MHINILQTIINVSTLAVLLPVIIGWINWQQYTQRKRSLVIITTCVAIVQLGIMMQTDDNTALHHVYIGLESFGLIYLFAQSIRHPLIRSLRTFLALIPTLFIATELWFQSGSSAFPVTARSAEAILLIAMSAFYFAEAMQSAKNSRPEHTFYFWMSTAILIYFTPNLLYFLFQNKVAQVAPELSSGLLALHAVFHILMYALYTMALLCKPKTL